MAKLFKREGQDVIIDYLIELDNREKALIVTALDYFSTQFRSQSHKDELQVLIDDIQNP